MAMLGRLAGLRAVQAAARGPALAHRAFAAAAAPEPAAMNDRMTASKRGESWMLSLTGPNRIGIVRDMVRGVADFGANVEESRSATLGGEFAIISRITVEAANAQPMINAVRDAFPDHDLHAKPTTARVETPPDHKTLKVLLEGPDSTGIVASLTETLAKNSVNIHNMETEVLPAPFAGYPIFQVDLELTFPETAMEEISKGIKAVEEKYGMTATFSEE